MYTDAKLITAIKKSFGEEFAKLMEDNLSPTNMFNKLGA